MSMFSMDRDNKNKYDNEDRLKEEQQLINEIKSTLHKQYGYSPHPTPGSS
jgi:hypothetical protein